MPDFLCYVFIGCCFVPQFGAYVSLMVGDFRLLNHTTVHGADNKNFTVSLQVIVWCVDVLYTALCRVIGTLIRTPKLGGKFRKLTHPASPETH